MIEEPAASASSPSECAEARVISTLSSLDVAAEEVERYGMHPDQYIEWYGPEDGRHVVFIHGGYFHEDGTLSYLRPAALALGEAGYRVALPEYRRGAGQPEVTFEDIHTLARHPKLSEVVWLGHSMGCVFVLHVLFSLDTKVTHVVALSPVADLARAAQEDHDHYEHNPVARWLGGMPAEIPDIYGRWEPFGLYAELGSSGFQQRALRLDIIHGSLDKTVPVSRTKDLLNEPFNIAIVQDDNHNDTIRPGSDSWLLLLGCLG